MDRKKWLLGSLLLVGAGFGGDALYRGWVEQPFAEQAKKKVGLEKQQGEIRTQLVLGKKLLQALPAFEDKSLPANTNLARQQYQAWCWQVLKRHEIEGPSVEISQARDRSLAKKAKKDDPADFREFNVSVRGTGTLAQTTQVLDDFYAAPFLHQIESLNVTPIGNGQVVTFSFSISAISLPSATETEKLPGQSDDDARRLAEQHPLRVAPQALAETSPAMSATSAVKATDVDPLMGADPRVAAGAWLTEMETSGPRVNPSTPGEIGNGQIAALSPSGASLAAGDPQNDSVQALVSENNNPATEESAFDDRGGTVASELEPGSSDRPWRSIVKRNLFAAGGGMTIAQSITLSAITQDKQGQVEAWFQVGKSPAARIVSLGETLREGVLEVQVQGVADNAIIVTIEGESFKVRLGQTIAEAM